MVKRLVFGLFVAVLGMAALWSGRKPGTIGQSYNAAPLVSKPPMAVKSVIPTRFDVASGPALSRVTRLLWPSRSDPLVRVLHAIHCLSEESNPPGPGSPTIAEMRSLLLDFEASRRWYGKELSLIGTRNGARYLTSGSHGAQAHLNQCLAVLAGSGVPLATRINSPQGNFTVEDVLNDAVATYDPVSEIEWTAIALGLYWPPRVVWQNKFKEEFDFDMLVKTLLSRRLDNRSCAGTHVLYALALLFRVDQQQPILGREVRECLTNFLTRVRDQVASRQREDGAVEFLWFRSMLDDPWYTNLVTRVGSRRAVDGVRAVQQDLDAVEDWSNVSKRDLNSRFNLVLSTGHHVEWLMLLPAEMQPGHSFFENSLRFLNSALQEAADTELRDGFCPYSHAARALRLLSVSAGDGSVGH